MSSFAREIPCYAGQFGSYYLTKVLIVKVGLAPSMLELKPWHVFFAGGVGGFFAWLVSYP